MKSLILFLFVVGIILITTSNQKSNLDNLQTERIVEYRFIPRSIYDEQMNSTELTKSFADMFEKHDFFLNSPYK
jgi:hypothetical protein